MNVYTEVTGQNNKEDVVILHGWGFHHAYARSIADQLNQRYRVTNTDVPGRGKTGWHDSIKTIHDMADLLLPYLPAKAAYIGWSIGGSLSISIAARYPERVTHFIGVGTTPKFIESEDWLGAPFPGFEKPIAELIEKAGSFKEFLRRYFENEFADINPKPAAYHEIMKINDNDPLVANMDYFFKGSKIIDTADLRKEFSTLRCPIDFINGDLDEAINKTDYNKLKMLNPKTKVHIIPGARHVPHYTHPAEFNKILKSIL